ncbi:MAG: hypothetical protein ACLUGF_07185 [Clostridium sp.]
MEFAIKKHHLPCAGRWRYPTQKIELWERLSVIGLKQCVIVSTCNRSEIFYFSHSDAVTGSRCSPATRTFSRMFRLGITVRKRGQ